MTEKKQTFRKSLNKTEELIKTLDEYFSCIQEVREYARRTKDDKLFKIVRFKGEKEVD